MTEASTLRTDPARPEATPAVPSVAALMLEMSKTLMPRPPQATAEQSITDAKRRFRVMKALVEEMTDLFQHAYVTSAADIEHFCLKLLEAARDNANNAFDSGHDLMAAESPAQAFDHSMTHIRKQLDLTSRQSMELSDLFCRSAIENVGPIGMDIFKSFEEIAKLEAELIRH